MIIDNQTTHGPATGTIPGVLESPHGAILRTPVVTGDQRFFRGNRDSSSAVRTYEYAVKSRIVDVNDVKDYELP